MKSVDTHPFSSTELYVGIAHWLSQGEKEELEFDIDDKGCTLSQIGNTVRCVMETEFNLKKNFSLMETLLKIAAPSLLTFSGAVCVNPADGRFCLVKSLRYPCSVEDIVNAVEMLSNQSSVWSDVVNKYSHKAKKMISSHTGWDTYRRQAYV